jgi:hypothetical protein
VFSNNLFANNKITKTTVVDNEWQANFESKSLARWSYILHSLDNVKLEANDESQGYFSYQRLFLNMKVYFSN